jgi:hypothetical protein
MAKKLKKIHVRHPCTYVVIKDFLSPYQTILNEKTMWREANNPCFLLSKASHEKISHGKSA